MTEYTLSVVQLCPDAYADAADAIAEAAGYGPRNLSVRLQGAGGALWRGCHAWWIPESLSAAINAPDNPPEVSGVLAHVVTAVVNTGRIVGPDGTVYAEAMSDAELSDVALTHWQSALAANGLSVVEPAE